MMECGCCNSEIANGMSICPICGFPTLIGNFGEEISSLIAEHRFKILNNISIKIKLYHYKIMDDDNVQETAVEYVTIANAFDLVDQAIHWFYMEFERLESNREIDIELNIVQNEASKMMKISVRPDNVIGHSKIGICMCKGFQIRLAVGDEENYVLSEPTSIL